MKLPFKKVYNFRPGLVQPTKGLKNMMGFYKYFRWTIPVIKLMAPGKISTLEQLGTAMINAAVNGYDKQTIEVKDILTLAKE